MSHRVCAPVRVVALLIWSVILSAAAPCQEAKPPAPEQKRAIPAASLAVGLSLQHPDFSRPKIMLDLDVPAADFAPSIVWVPVRAAVPPTASDELVVAAVGDIMLGSTFPDTTGNSLPPEDGVHLLDEVAPLLKSADLAIGNLEGPLYDGAEPSAKCAHKAEGTCYAFRVPTRYAKLLADSGFVAMGVANNHANDFGPAGQQSSVMALTSVGIAQSGATGSVAHFSIKGKKVSYIAFATYPQFNNLLDLDAATELVRAEAQSADFVIVSFHGGGEGADRQHVLSGDETFLGEDRGDLRRFTHAMIDAGAAMVFGHGPHVVRGMEIYKDHLIAYSLGNFATYGHINLRGVNGLTLVLAARLGDGGKFLGGKIVPAFQPYPGGPRLDPDGRIFNVVRSLSDADFGRAAVTVATDGTIISPVAPAVVSNPSVIPLAAPGPGEGRQRDRRDGRSHAGDHAEE